jgi:hypothetical protein
MKKNKRPVCIYRPPLSLLSFKPGCIFNFGGQPGERGQVRPAVSGLATE